MYPSLKEKLYRQAMLASNTLDAGELKRSITQVTPLQDIFEWGRVNAYFRRLEETLDGIVEKADQLTAEDLLETSLHGIERLDKSLERVDDSGAYRESARQLLRELHRRALERLEWAPQERAEHLLELALADPWDQFEGVPLAMPTPFRVTLPRHSPALAGRRSGTRDGRVPIAFDPDLGEKRYTAVAALAGSNRGHRKHSIPSKKCDMDSGWRCDNCDMSAREAQTGRQRGHNRYKTGRNNLLI